MLIADQARVIGADRLVTSPRALAEHLRQLTQAAVDWLDTHPLVPRADAAPPDDPAGRVRLTIATRHALALALHAAGAAAPARC